MWPQIHDISELDRAILRRAVVERDAGPEPCAGCGRTPLIGEEVHVYEDGVVLCDLCREPSGGRSVASRVVRGPAFGDTLRVGRD
jgi:hypothetical protein